MASPKIPQYLNHLKDRLGLALKWPSTSPLIKAATIQV